jgi:hypothetical protein
VLCKKCFISVFDGEMCDCFKDEPESAILPPTFSSPIHTPQSWKFIKTDEPSSEPADWKPDLEVKVNKMCPCCCALMEAYRPDAIMCLECLFYGIFKESQTESITDEIKNQNKQLKYRPRQVVDNK